MVTDYNDRIITSSQFFPQELRDQHFKFFTPLALQYHQTASAHPLLLYQRASRLASSVGGPRLPVNEQEPLTATGTYRYSLVQVQQN